MTTGGDPAFWANIQRYFFHHTTWERAEDEAVQVLALAGLQPGATILDLCCGPGRVAVELADLGARVTGVDLAQPLLDQAAERAVGRGVEVEWVGADARTFHRDGAFDAVFNLWTSFGYGDDPADDARVLANVHRSLAPDGVLVLETLGKEAIARRPPPRLWSEYEDASFIVAQEVVVEPGWDHVTHRWIVIDGDDRQEHRLTHRLYSAAELTSLLTDSGFEAIEVFGGFDARPYESSNRMVVRARR